MYKLDGKEMTMNEVLNRCLQEIEERIKGSDNYDYIGEMCNYFSLIRSLFRKDENEIYLCVIKGILDMFGLKLEEKQINSDIERLKEYCSLGESLFCEEIEKQVRENYEEKKGFKYMPSLDAMWSAWEMNEKEDWYADLSLSIYQNIQDYIMLNTLQLSTEDIEYIRKGE